MNWSKRPMKQTWIPPALGSNGAEEEHKDEFTRVFSNPFSRFSSGFDPLPLRRLEHSQLKIPL
jgi:hypothetical protein